MAMKFVCPKCRYIFRVRSGNTKCPRRGNQPSQDEIKLTAIVGLIAMAVVVLIVGYAKGVEVISEVASMTPPAP